ncbi:penicillin-binding transpeptidase domain-containing protein [Desulfovibrio inopinatus]|uniref:penicillin-binding transpeptidase domain-containing protein n=1 Tax=Desulfovibrio inopinatus TaxID=102109 RepID=UPI0004257280|nr:penicillin-binding transpeptidase domain-containing protein [Desulfovibrio inopinatus]
MSGKQTPMHDFSRTKVTVVMVLVFVLWAALWIRAGQLQIVRGPELAERALRQHLALESDRGSRGQILDRSGQLLAKSVAFTSVHARPAQISDLDYTVSKLAPILKQNPAKLKQRLSSSKSFIFLARQIDDKTAAQLEDVNLRGVYLTTEYGRSYPHKHLAGQLLGFVGIDDTGLDGLEKSFNSILAGKKAKYAVQRDAAGRRLYLDAQGKAMENTDGDNLRLTIDAQVQFFAEDALEKAVTDNHGTAGVCIVVDVPTAEILAWANYPFFNPNTYKRGRPASRRNRLALDLMEPGSTMKPLLVAAALQEGVVRPDSVFNCENGRWRIGRHAIRDTHSYGLIPVNKIIRWSSNIGAAKIAMELGSDRLYSYFKKMGFTDPTGLPLPGESGGMIRPPGAWGDIGLATAAFGQGVAITPIQLVQAFYTLASGGIMRPLRLVLDPADETRERTSYRLFDERVARAVQDMMREVVEEDHGTGSRAGIKGMHIGGKTGTAQKAAPSGGYGNKYIASFIGFYPAYDPQYIVYIMVDEPEPSHYGGVVSAPAVRDVALRTMSYFGQMPDAAFVVQKPNPSLVSASSVGQRAATFHRSIEKEHVVIGDTVPDLLGMPLRRAVEILASKGIIPSLEGDGLIISKQAPQAGEGWPKGENRVFTLWLARST